MRSLLARKPGTPRIHLLGVFLCLWFSNPLNADCGKPDAEIFSVTKVIDGDTLRLSTGQSVRVLGVNAPEVTHGRQLGQPLGVEARAAASAFIAAAGNQVRLGFERQRHDRYGRLLAHVYNLRGHSLAASLLREGMVLHIAVPPNADQSNCLLRLESQARKSSNGIWRQAYWQPRPVSSLGTDDVGFKRVKGTVKQVVVNNKGILLELDGNLVARVAKADLHYFPALNTRDWTALEGKTLELRGWITVNRTTKAGSKPLVMQLRSPTSFAVTAL